MRIRVTPDELHTLATQLRAASFALNEVRLLIARAWSGLGWEVRQDAGLESLVIQAQRLAHALNDEAERMGRSLEQRAFTFEQADQEGQAHIAQSSGMWLASLGGVDALRHLPAFTFPSSRVQAHLRLGEVLGASSISHHLARVSVEPDERRALFNFAGDLLLSKIKPLDMFKDLLDVTRVPAWNQRVEGAFRTWETTRLQYGVNAPRSQDAYGRYIEELIFKMPFFGKDTQALLAVLKILGRKNPVE